MKKKINKILGTCLIIYVVVAVSVSVIKTEDKQINKILNMKQKRDEMSGRKERKFDFKILEIKTDI